MRNELYIDWEMVGVMRRLYFTMPSLTLNCAESPMLAAKLALRGLVVDAVDSYTNLRSKGATIIGAACTRVDVDMGTAGPANASAQVARAASIATKRVL